MTSAHTVAAAGLQSYEQALTYLRQDQYELAFVAAKQALDVAAVASKGPGRRLLGGGSHDSQLVHCAQCWSALAAAAAGMGDLEVAYHLYARGYSQIHDAAKAAEALGSSVHCANQQQQRQQQHDLRQLVQQLAAGKLDMLSAMCEVSPLSQHHLQQQQQQHRSKGQYNLTAAPRPQQQQHASSKGWQQLHDRFSLTSSSRAGRSRVFCVSDLHVDAPGGANMSWVKQISSTAFKNDVLIAAGDVGDTAAAVQTAFQLLAPKFRRVVWVPGNHEAWLRPGSKDRETYPDSFSKLLALRQIAKSCGVDIGPIEVTPGLLIAPLMSWYNCQFDTADPRPGRYRHDSFCSWPVPEDDMWQVMMKLNTQTLAMVTQRIAKLRGHPTTTTTTTTSSSSGCRAVKTQQQLSRQVHPEPTTGLCGTGCSRHSCRSSGNRFQNDCSGGSDSSSGKGHCSKVTWNEDGVLAVQSERKVPGLQINLQPRSKQHLQHRLAEQPMQQSCQRCESVATAHHSSGRDADSTASFEAATQTIDLIGQEQLQHHRTQAQRQSAGPPQTVEAPTATGKSHFSAQEQEQLQQRVDQAADGARTAAVEDTEQPVPDRGIGSNNSTELSPLVITVSHFLPHSALPHHHVSELSKAMGCLQLQMQLQQVASSVHVYGHSHVNTDVVLPTPKEYTVGSSLAGPALHRDRSCDHETSASPGLRASQPHFISSRHVGGVCFGTDAGGAYKNAAGCSGGSVMPGHRRYVQYALDAVDARTAGLYCLWDGERLTTPGYILPVECP